MAVSSTTSANNIYSSIAAKNKGVGGLVSGLDTETLVESLTSTTRSKIATQQQKKTMLQWKQTAYRSVATTLREFQAKYFDNTSSTNMKSTAFYNAYKGTSSNSAVTVKTSSSSVPGTFTIDAVTSLATNKQITTTGDFSVDLTASKAFSGSDDYTGKTITLRLDDSSQSDRTIKLDTLNGLSAADAQTELQRLVDNAFGSGMIGVTLDSSDKLGFSSAGGSNKITVTSDTSSLGFTSGQSNVITSNTTLADIFAGSKGAAGDLTGSGADGKTLEFTINGKKITASTSDTLGQLQTKINSSGCGAQLAYSSLTGNFTLTSTKLGAGETLEIADVSGDLMNQLFDGAVTTEGKNATIVVTVDGVQKTISQTSNSFKINGTTLEVNELYNEAQDPSVEPIKIGVTMDASSLVDKIKTFIEDYNTLLTALNTILKEDKNSDYTALSDEQKEDMTDAEIEKWETEAKKGILRNDSTLSSIVNQMRGVFYKQVESVGLSPYQIGITTQSMMSSSSTGDYSINQSKNGLLELDEDKLLAALETNGDAVRQMFTDTENGFAKQFETIISKAVNTSSDKYKRGTLVTMAGTTDITGDNTSTLGNRIDAIDAFISKLKTRLENEYTRYWKKFSALETAISNMNTQSSWLTEQSSS